MYCGILIESLCALSAVLMVTDCVQSKATELSFELPDREQLCYHEDVEAGTKLGLDYQVLHGGDRDVDVTLYSPSRIALYQELRMKWDSQEWNATETGQYTFCFSNEFSSYSHKLIWIELRVGEEDQLPETAESKAAANELRFTMEAEAIHENLESIVEAQTHYRIAEAIQRKRAEDLNSRVVWWSSIETVVFFLMGLMQVYIIKSFFSRHHLYAPVS